MNLLLNELGGAASRAGVSMFAQTVVLALVLLTLEVITRGRLRATLRCALWLLVVFKVLLPPAFNLPTSVAYWMGPWLVAPVRVSAPPVDGTSIVTSGAAKMEALPSSDTESAVLHPSVPQARLNLWAGLGLIWLTGAAVMMGWIVRRNLEVHRLVRGSHPPSADQQRALEEAARRVGLRRLPQLRLTEQFHSPAVCGLFRPVVLLPQGLAENLSATALGDVFLHELIHIHRRDLWLNLPQTLAVALWWWNPFVWLANARVASLREQAVDERVMLLRNGDPATYPATLVEVARHCASGPALTLSLVGILESRRALRARVERLLVSPLPSRAHLGATGWITVIGAALLLVPMAFARRVESAAGVNSAESARTPIRGDSGLALPAPATGPSAQHFGIVTTSSPAISASGAASNFYQMDPVLARRYGLVPATNLGEARPAIMAYQMDPVLARRYGLIPPPERTNSEAKPRLNPATATNASVRSDAQESQDSLNATRPGDWGLGHRIIKMKLEGIVLPELDFEGRTLADLVEHLEGQAQALDPERKGVNFMISDSETAAGVNEPTTGREGTLSEISFRPQTPLRNVRLVDALDAMVGLANQPLRYEVQDYAVVFSSPPPQVPELYTKTFQVGTNTFLSGLQAVIGVKLPAEFDPKRGAAVQAAVRDFFRACGVAFPSPGALGLLVGTGSAGGTDPLANQSALFFNERTGVLFVRGTLSELDIIDKAVEALNVAPPEIELEARFFEVEPKTAQGIWAEYFNVGADSTNRMPVLTPTQFKRFVTNLEARPGTLLRGFTRVRTLSARQARISVMEKNPVVDQMTGKGRTLELRPVLDVIPYLLSGNPSIQLELVAVMHQETSTVFSASLPAPDGHTVMLLADVGKSGASSEKLRPIVVLITPIVVDPAGKPVSSDK